MIRFRRLAAALAVLVPVLLGPSVARAASAGRPLTFTVTGTAKRAVVTYNDVARGTPKTATVTLPWSVTFAAGDGRYTVVAVNASGTGTLSCSIDTGAPRKPASAATPDQATCTVDRTGSSDLSTVKPASSTAANPLDVATTVYPKLQAPGQNVLTRLNVSGELVEWLANPTTVSVFLPPDSGRTIPAPTGVQLRDTAVVGDNVFAVDTKDRLLVAALAHDGFSIVASVPGAAAIYSTPKEVWVRTKIGTTKTMRRFDGVSGKELVPLPKVHGVLANSSTRIAAFADGATAASLDLVVYDAATMRERSRDVFTKAMSSGAWIAAEQLMLAFPDEVVVLDYTTHTKRTLPGVKSNDLIGDPRSGTVMAFTDRHFGVWLPQSGKVIDVGAAPSGAAGLDAGRFWAWTRRGLVNVDLVKLYAALAARGYR